MEIRKVKAKSILTHCNPNEDWFGHKYRMNIYRGCEHACIYCDSRSSCYGIDDFDSLTIKENSIDLLIEELSKKRVKGIIGTGAMSDPYTISEKDLGITREVLAVISRFGFPLHLQTKSDLILRDLDLLQKINQQTYVNVTFTITTPHDELSVQLESFAPVTSFRLDALKAISDAGIYTGVALMPVLPFIEDKAEDIAEIVRLSAQNGAKYVIPGFGVTLRDQQRLYFYKELDKRFPGVRKKYEQTYAEKYFCACPNYELLKNTFKKACKKHNLATHFSQIKKWKSKEAQQPSLF